MKYKDIQIGDVYSFEKTLSKKDVLDFAKLTGDNNKLHVDESFGKNSRFKRNISHGMLAGSLFSTIIGVHCPGENGFYVSQTLNFKNPIFYDDDVTVKGTIINKNDGVNMITLKTEILKEDKVVVSGEAKAVVYE